MITLIIKEKGHLVDIPGHSQFRTPATIDISKGDIRQIIGYLKVCDITDYEIIASNNSGKEIYKPKDFNIDHPKIKKKKDKKSDSRIEKRIDRMEKMIKKLYETSSNDSGKKLEQTTNQMEQFQKNVLDVLGKLQNMTMKNMSNKTILQELEEETVDPFIPDIDTEGMRLRSQGGHKTVKKEEDSDDAADALSKLLINK